MIQGLLVALVGGLMLAQQPRPLVTQSELPPPGASQSKQTTVAPAPKAAAPAAKEPARAPKTEAVKEAAPVVNDATEKPRESANKAPAGLPAVEGKSSAGGRVAAFWVILPGK
jgi:hypothetical protein